MLHPGKNTTYTSEHNLCVLALWTVLCLFPKIVHHINTHTLTQPKGIAIQRHSDSTDIGDNLAIKAYTHHSTKDVTTNRLF